MSFIHLSTAAQNACATALATLVDADASPGYLELYLADGDGIPANANTAITDQTLLSEHTLSATAFATVVAGLIVANAIGQDATPAASGAPAFARLYDGSGAVILDMDVGLTGTTMIVTSSVTVGVPFLINSGQFQMPSIWSA